MGELTIRSVVSPKINVVCYARRNWRVGALQRLQSARFTCLIMLVVGQQIIVVLTSTSWGSSSVVSGKIRKRLELPESGAIQLPCSHEPPSFFLSTYVHPPVRCSIERMRTKIFSGHQTDLTSQRDTTDLLHGSYRLADVFSPTTGIL